MRCSVPVALGVLVMATTLRAADDPPGEAKKPPTPRQQYEALAEEYKKAKQDYFTALRAAKTREERQKISHEKRPNPARYAGRILKLAEDNPEDPVDIDALIWVVQNDESDPDDPTPTFSRAFDLLVRDYADQPKLGTIVPAFSQDGSPRSEQLLRTILDKNRSREARGQA